eukprot:6202205-Pleurochrysis_carterae.AAC.2
MTTSVWYFSNSGGGAKSRLQTRVLPRACVLTARPLCAQFNSQSSSLNLSHLWERSFSQRLSSPCQTLQLRGGNGGGKGGGSGGSVNGGFEELGSIGPGWPRIGVEVGARDGAGGDCDGGG